ncbi:MAG: hypothetical protein JXR97_12620 [Planctomycetes bacterium]|nr:hypothetical protein [Planctomycetota bacterium]
MKAVGSGYHGRSWAFCFIFGAFLLLAGGCGEPLTAYRAAGHDPKAVKKMLVLPFLDARTFRDEKDPVNDNLDVEARDIFVSAIKANDLLKDKEIITPDMHRSKDSLTTEQAIALGRKYGADAVVVGQIFSYTETRAASIPPRAGMFIRIFSVPDKRIVFVGDHYQSAGGPGATGGRKRQAEMVAEAIVKSYVVSKKETQSAYDPGSILVRTESDKTDAPTVLLLPYQERANPSNLIDKTGGGAVVSSLFTMELGKYDSFRIVNPYEGQADSSRLLTPEEAIALAKELGADYVVRGQVVEFRRAMSVPSIYSAIISTAILAAQVLFAEVSGVDVATEVWRVKDGKCIFAKRDVRKQKYVVQAERTVRRIASITVPELVASMSASTKEFPEPLIDAIVVPQPRIAKTATETAGDTEVASESKTKQDEQKESATAKTEEKAGEKVDTKTDAKADEQATASADRAEEKKAAAVEDKKEDAAVTDKGDEAATKDDKSTKTEADGGAVEKAPEKAADDKSADSAPAAEKKTAAEGEKEEEKPAAGNATDKPAEEATPAAEKEAGKAEGGAEPETADAISAANQANAGEGGAQNAGQNPFKKSMEGVDY